MRRYKLRWLRLKQLTRSVAYTAAGKNETNKNSDLLYLFMQYCRYFYYQFKYTGWAKNCTIFHCTNFCL